MDDNEYRKLLDFLIEHTYFKQSPRDEREKEWLENYEFRNGCILCRHKDDRILVQRNKVQVVFDMCHTNLGNRESGPHPHFNSVMTEILLKQNFYWEDQDGDLWNLLNSCIICQVYDGIDKTIDFQLGWPCLVKLSFWYLKKHWPDEEFNAIEGLLTEPYKYFDDHMLKKHYDKFCKDSSDLEKTSSKGDFELHRFGVPQKMLGYFAREYEESDKSFTTLNLPSWLPYNTTHYSDPLRDVSTRIYEACVLSSERIVKTVKALYDDPKVPATTYFSDMIELGPTVTLEWILGIMKRYPSDNRLPQVMFFKKPNYDPATVNWIQRCQRRREKMGLRTTSEGRTEEILLKSGIRAAVSRYDLSRAMWHVNVDQTCRSELIKGVINIEAESGTSGLATVVGSAPSQDRPRRRSTSSAADKLRSLLKAKVTTEGARSEDVKAASNIVAETAAGDPSRDVGSCAIQDRSSTRGEPRSFMDEPYNRKYPPGHKAYELHMQYIMAESGKSMLNFKSVLGKHFKFDHSIFKGNIQQVEWGSHSESIESLVGFSIKYIHKVLTDAKIQLISAVEAMQFSDKTDLRRLPGKRDTREVHDIFCCLLGINDNLSGSPSGYSSGVGHFLLMLVDCRTKITTCKVIRKVLRAKELKTLIMEKLEYSLSMWSSVNLLIPMTNYAIRLLLRNKFKRITIVPDHAVRMYCGHFYNVLALLNYSQLEDIEGGITKACTSINSFFRALVARETQL